MYLFLTPPAAEILAGHRSWTQKKIGALNLIFAIIAGIPTVIGDGWKTNILSKEPLMNKILKDPKNTNEK